MAEEGVGPGGVPAEKLRLEGAERLHQRPMRETHSAASPTGALAFGLVE